MSEIADVKAYLQDLPEVSSWPELNELLEAAGGSIDWSLPLAACEAVGAEAEQALPAAAAILLSQISIIFVDDMLDEDPRGEHVRQGVGPTANLALGLQSAAFHALARADVPAERRAEAIRQLSAMLLETARGQHLDAQHPATEEEYWAVVRAKSTPFYGAALQLGALLGGAAPEVADGLYDIGILVGEVVQLHDDLLDAFESPANPDWRHPGNNLLLRYALTADHTDRERFAELAAQVDDPARLAEAQQILIRGGAVSYCAYHLLLRHRQAAAQIDSLDLPRRESMLELLVQQLRPLVHLLEEVGAEVPEELLA